MKKQPVCILKRGFDKRKAERDSIRQHYKNRIRDLKSLTRLRKGKDDQKLKQL